MPSMTPDDRDDYVRDVEGSGLDTIDEEANEEEVADMARAELNGDDESLNNLYLDSVEDYWEEARLAEGRAQDEDGPDADGTDGRDSQALSGAWYPDERFADENGDVPSFSPDPALPGEGEARTAWEDEFDQRMDAWQEQHAGQDIVQSLDGWITEQSAEDADEAEL